MVKIRTEKAITFDDVLLVPQKTTLLSRSEVNLSTQLTRNIRLNLPIISANMDTVTESRMAISLAQSGGVGIIHRFLSIEDQVKEVTKVKRYEHFRIDDPITLPYNATYKELKQILIERHVKSVLIVDSQNTLRGIVTRRDWMFIRDPKIPVRKFMTPVTKLITARPSITIDDAKTILTQHKLEKLPLVDGKGVVKGLITARDVFTVLNDHIAARDHKGRLIVGAAIGIKSDDISIRTKALVEAGVDAIVIDIAHGHSIHLIHVLKDIKKRYPNCDVIAGNVATYQGAKDLIDAGADAIKVGIGPGSLCTTRIVAGAGVPQITAIMDVFRAARPNNIPIIADGGIRTSGDIVKALAAGASSVMIGSYFAGCKESPAFTFYRDGQKYKLTRGMASLAANKDRRKLDNRADNTLGGIGEDGNLQKEIGEYTAEGVEAIVTYKGSVSDILFQLAGGVRSGMSYSGAKTIPEFWKKAEFVTISHSALVESHPHNVSEL